MYMSVFNKSSIYDVIFINVKGVLEYPTSTELKINNPQMFNNWKTIFKTKTGLEYDLSDGDIIQNAYVEYGSRIPELLKIVAITYAKVNIVNGVIKRDIKKISHSNEIDIIQSFMDVLRQQYDSTTQDQPIICGYNVIAYDIPLLIKKHIQHRNKLINRELPLILKMVITSKPWESAVVDVVNVWKFNGYDLTSLMMISDFIGLKKIENILHYDELSRYYWNNVDLNPDGTIDYIVKQSANQTNIVIQFMNELRQL